MKKSLVALAALAVAGVASAQSSVTLFGVVDASISSVSNKSELTSYSGTGVGLPGSLKSSKTGLNNSAYNSSRIGFRGTEDLGGGLAASFWLEAGVNNDTGDGASSATINGTSTSTNGLAFNRRSTVSLSGGFGEFRLGRDYKPTFWNFTVFDPFGTNGSGTALIQKAAGLESSNVRASNSVGYFLPSNLGGFYGQVQYGFHEQTKYSNGVQSSANNNSRGGRYAGGRFGYANGPLDVALAYGVQTNTSDYAVGTDTTAKNLNFGASYDFGVVKLFGQIASIERQVEYSEGGEPAYNPSTKMNGYLLGVTVPVGAGQIRASYGYVKSKVDPAATAFYEAPKAQQVALGYVHNLSKRTALYATGTYVRNKNGAAFSAGSGNIDAGYVSSYGTGSYTPKTSIGYDFGIRHAF
jgi:predicted porin